MSELNDLRIQIEQYEENERELMLCIVALNEAFREKLIPETWEQEEALYKTLETMRKVLDRRDKYKYGL